jgi:hypothetical protein
MRAGRSDALEKFEQQLVYSTVPTVQYSTVLIDASEMLTCLTCQAGAPQPDGATFHMFAYVTDSFGCLRKFPVETVENSTGCG